MFWTNTTPFVHKAMSTRNIPLHGNNNQLSRPLQKFRNSTASKIAFRNWITNTNEILTAGELRYLRRRLHHRDDVGFILLHVAQKMASSTTTSITQILEIERMRKTVIDLRLRWNDVQLYVYKWHQVSDHYSIHFDNQFRRSFPLSKYMSARCMPSIGIFVFGFRNCFFFAPWKQT